MSKTIIKIVTGLFLGLLITMGIKSTVKAEVYYYVNTDGVYAVDKDTYMYAKMPAGSIIPAGATVYIEKDASATIDTGIGSLAGKSAYGWWYNPKFTATENLKVGYTDDGVSLKHTYNVFGTGEDVLGAKKAEYIGKMGYYYNKNIAAYPYVANNWSSPVMPSWTAPTWTSPTTPYWNSNSDIQATWSYLNQ